MPVTAYSGAQTSTGNGVTTVFPYGWRILDQTNIEVKVDGAVKTLGSDYTVDGVGNPGGGNITFGTAPANGAVVQRARKVPYVRATDYQRSGSFDEETVDKDFDSTEMQVQQIAADVARAFKAPLSVTADQALSDADWAARAGRYLSFNGSGVLTVTESEVPVSAVKPYPSVASGTRFVFVGDSKTSGPTTPTAFPAYFAALPSSSGLGTVVNLGVSGYKLSDLVANYAANVKPYAPGQSLNLGSVPTVLGVWIGANDVFQLTVLGYADAAAYYAALSAYVNTAIADGFRVMLFTVDARGDHVEFATEFYRIGVNYLIRHNTAATWIVDPEVVFNDYTDAGWWNADKIHYIAAGYARLAKLIAQTLLAGGAQVLPGIKGVLSSVGAVAGDIGEHISSSVASGSAVGLTTGVGANVTSISLTPGDWDVWGSVIFAGNGATTVTYLIGSISQVSGVVDGTVGRKSTDYFGGAAVFAAVLDQHENVNPIKLNLAATTTIYLVAQAGFAVNTCSAYGILQARRRR